LAWIVLGLIGLGILVLLVSFEEDSRETLVTGVVFLLVAGLLIQELPQTASGVQFVPLPPWHYSGWFSRTISVVSWLCIALASLCVFSNVKTDWPAAAGAILIAIALNALLSFAGTSEVAESHTPRQRPSVVQSFRERLAQCDTLRKDRMEALEKLLADKESLVARIRGLGCRSKADLMSHRIGRTLVSELEHLSRQIASLQREVEAIEAVLERAQSMQRSIEREAMLKGHGALPENEYTRLSQIDHELQEELRKIIAPVPGTEVQIDKLLEGLLEQGDRNHG
jgi:hypothetical protein